MKYTILFTFCLISSSSFGQDNLAKFKSAIELFSNGQLTTAIGIFEEVYETKKHPDIAFFLAYGYAKKNNRERSKKYLSDIRLKYHDLTPAYHDKYQIIDLWTRYPYVKYGITQNNYSDSDLFPLFSGIDLPIPNEQEVIEQDKQNEFFENLLKGN
jgi:hypothetical protein